MSERMEKILLSIVEKNTQLLKEEKIPDELVFALLILSENPDDKESFILAFMALINELIETKKNLSILRVAHNIFVAGE